jgi:hypothetical protein
MLAGGLQFATLGGAAQRAAEGTADAVREAAARLAAQARANRGELQDALGRLMDQQHARFQQKLAWLA